MAKKKAAVKTASKSASTEAATITITYDLFDLPTAQHKAGLAGLLMQIEHMKSRRPRPAVPRVVDLTPTSATVEFSADTVQSLMNSLYDAKTVEVKVKSKWPNTMPLREDFIEEADEDGKKKTVKAFVYEVCQPQGNFLRQHLPSMDESKGWLKLWRDMLWAIPRGNPQSRKPFEQRAADDDCTEGPDAWDDLQKVEKAKANNGFYTDQVAGSLWLGAQALNAEGIPFEGRAEQTLLLHFWPLASLVYVPQVLKPDGDSEFVGYVLAIPEVANLVSFIERFPVMLAGLGTEIHGFRPAEAVIDLPAQGAISLLEMEHLAQLASDKVSASEVQSAIAAVEFLHLVKIGNNIKTMSAGRIAPRPHLLERYLDIVGRPGQSPPYGNPHFRRCLMTALLNEVPWFEPFSGLFADWPHRFFVPTDDPPRLSWFWIDSRSKLTQLEKEHGEAMKTEPQSVPPEDRLAILVHRLTRTYLAERAKQKSGIDPENFKNDEKVAWDKIPKDFFEARRDAGEGLFLEFRSRREQAFVNHFAQTFFAVKQYVNDDQYVEISEALASRWDDVKTLTLMSLSANS